MSLISRFRAISAKRVENCTDSELCDVIMYRRRTGDVEIQQQQQPMTEAELQNAVKFFRQYLLEEYGTLPNTGFGDL